MTTIGNLREQHLAELKDLTLRMAGLARAALDKAIRAVLERDIELAEAVLNEDANIDSLECELDRLNLRLLALEQPWAGDLRFIVGCMRMSVDIERIGDEAANIADRSLLLYSRPPLQTTTLLETFAGLARGLVDDAIRCFEQGDVDLARDICARNHEALNVNLKLLQDAVEFMIAESRQVERSIQVSFIGYSLKRICDLCANVAESVIFIQLGETIKHSCQDRKN